MDIATLVLSAFLAANMGVSGFAVAFTPSYGSGILGKKIGVILFGVAVMCGGLIFGPRVAETLVHKISSSGLPGISPFLILVTCVSTMFLSNVLKVPQSTSFVTVSGFTGAGLYFGQVNWATVTKIVVVATIFSALSFGLTYFISKALYPPRPGRFRFYEALMSKRPALRKFIIGHDVYAAFSVGTNNVANVVAPLLLIFNVPTWQLFLFMGPFFGVGAFFAGERLLKSVSKGIVTLGEFTAGVVSLITATFVLVASWLGLPAPYAQFSTFAVMGVSCVKDGFGVTLAKSIVQRILWVWLLVPVFTVGLSFGLHIVFMGVNR